jgi:hypothetical protein
MKKIVQYSEAELVRLLTKDLAATGHNVNIREFGVEFVTNAHGETSALITGIDPHEEKENVQEPETDEGPAPRRKAASTLREQVYDIVTVTLSKEGQTVDELVELVTEELSEEGKMPLASDHDAAHSIRVAILKSLQHLEKQGRSEYVDDGELELWRKKKSKKKSEPKVVPLNTAADILGGDGGVMDRSDALSEGASEGRPRQGATRRKKAPKRRGGGGGGRGPGGFGSGTPFTF